MLVGLGEVHLPGCSPSVDVEGLQVVFGRDELVGCFVVDESVGEEGVDDDVLLLSSARLQSHDGVHGVHVEVHGLVVGEWVEVEVKFGPVDVLIGFSELVVEEFYEVFGVGDDF